MAADRTIPKLALLSDEEITAITDTALRILWDIGVKILDEEVLRLLADTPGAAPELGQCIVRFSPELVHASLAAAPRSYALFGRDATRQAAYGCGGMIFKSTPGDPLWADPLTGAWRDPTLSDLRQAIDVGDGLSNIDIVGAMAHPAEIPEPVRDLPGGRVDEAHPQTGSRLGPRPCLGPLHCGDPARRRGRDGAAAPGADH